MSPVHLSPEDFEAALAVVPRVWRATSLDLDPPLEVGAFVCKESE